MKEYRYQLLVTSDELLELRFLLNRREAELNINAGCEWLGLSPYWAKCKVVVGSLQQKMRQDVVCGREIEIGNGRANEEA